jgi:aminoglycoside/choline kinase family phosphotransferase
MTLQPIPRIKKPQGGKGLAGMTAPSIAWADPARASAFGKWLAAWPASISCGPARVRPASADASFRRYFRVDAASGEGSYIVMDAPPAQEDCKPFVKIAGLMADAGLNAPRVLAWDEPLGFMLLSDLGAQTMMEVIAPPAAVDAIASPTPRRTMSSMYPCGGRPGALAARLETRCAAPL